MIVLKLQPPENSGGFLYSQTKENGDKNMKKYLLITGLICAATIPPATAVTKYVALTPSTTCSSFFGRDSDFSATCDGTSIEGIAFCGSQNGGSMGATTNYYVEISYTLDNNKYCWCRMISPAVSQWVFSRSYSTAASCATNCASTCAYNLRDEASIRASMFSNLSD